MSDLVVTIRRDRWQIWVAEEDEAIEEGRSRSHRLELERPPIEPGERVYFASHGLIRGYAPLVRLAQDGVWVLHRGRFVACSHFYPVADFRGFRPRQWGREIEGPFPDWRTRGVVIKEPKRYKKKPQAIPAEQSSLFGDS